MNDFICITRAEYDEMKIDSAERDNLLTLLFGTAKLDYGSELQMGGDAIRDLLKAQYPNRYENRVEILKKKQDEEWRKYKLAQNDEGDTDSE